MLDEQFFFANFFNIRIKDIQGNVLIFNFFRLAQIPNEEADRKLRTLARACKIDRRKHEAAFKFKLKNGVSEFLVVVGIDVFEF